MVEDYAEGTDDARRAEQARFASNILISTLAPTNYLPTNPAALKRAFDTGGRSLARGLGHFVDDLRNNGGMPRMVDPDAFEVGRNLALSPGAVVARDPMGEVLQYQPTTEQVSARPLLIIPPPINRFYVVDLSPGRSFVEYAVSQGTSTYLLSWRNPTAEQGDWNLDNYAQRVSDAIDTVREVSGSDDVNVIGFCAGGIITTTLLNHLTAIGDERVHSMSYAVTLLDFEFGDRAPINAMSSAHLLRFAQARSRRKGIISSRQMGAAFTWMRPDDLIWNYWVNNYLMGAEATRVRRAGVERRRHQPSRGAALRVPRHLREQRAGPARRGHRAGHADPARPDQGPDVRHRRGHRPPHARGWAATAPRSCSAASRRSC